MVVAMDITCTQPTITTNYISTLIDMPFNIIHSLLGEGKL